MKSRYIQYTFCLLCIAVVLVMSPFGVEVAHAQESTGLLEALELATSPLAAVVEGFANLIINLASYFEAFAGSIFDYALEQLVWNMSQMVSEISIIPQAWSILRDFANIAFIFVILYVAISYILNVGRFNMGRVLVRVVIVALLLNFSLFFTNIVIDFTNIIALQFDQAAEITNTATGKEAGYSTIIKQNLNTFGVSSFNWESAFSAALTASLGAVLLIIAGFVFLAGAALLVTRFVVLIAVMIFSPLAFVALISPNSRIRQYWNMWLNNLLSWSFLGPALTVMLYLTALIITTDAFQQSTSVAALFDPQKGLEDTVLAAMLNYMLVVGFLVMAIVLAKSLGDRLARQTVSFTSNRLSRAGAFMGRNTLGRAGRAMRDSKYLRDMARSDSKASRIAGRLGMRAGDKMAGANYDVRDTAGGTRVGEGLEMDRSGTSQSAGREKGSVDKILQDEPRTRQEEQQIIEAREQAQQQRQQVQEEAAQRKEEIQEQYEQQRQQLEDQVSKAQDQIQQAERMAEEATNNGEKRAAQQMRDRAEQTLQQKQARLSNIDEQMESELNEVEENLDNELEEIDKAVGDVESSVYEQVQKRQRQAREQYAADLSGAWWRNKRLKGIDTGVGNIPVAIPGASTNVQAADRIRNDLRKTSDDDTDKEQAAKEFLKKFDIDPSKLQDTQDGGSDEAETTEDNTQ